MTTEEKDLLLKDLCARLPYGVKCWVSYNKFPTKLVDVNVDTNLTNVGDDFFIVTVKLEKTGINKPSTIGDIKPYLRPMNSMTEEEMEKCRIERGRDLAGECGCESDYLNSIHIDYRGLIEKGLALEAPKDMYKTE